MTTVPAVSVLLAVHNGAPWVTEAIGSVLAQTLRDFELIVIDDGSADATPELISAFTDSRVRVERHARVGLTRSLNRAIALARAPLLARLDADDVAMPDRLARQHAFMRAHPDVGLLGGAAREVDTEGRLVREVTPPLDDASLRRLLIRRNPFVHSAVMFRREVIDRVGPYDERWPVAQDYELWMRISRVSLLANLDAVLVTRRLVSGRITSQRDSDRLWAEARARWHAVRAGRYPWWTVVHAARPALARALPRPLREAMRRAFVSPSPPSEPEPRR